MKSLFDSGRVTQLLCIGAHPDDIELGAGGLVMRLVRNNPALKIHWVVFCGAAAERAMEARRAASVFADAGNLKVEVHAFRDAFLPWQGADVKVAFEDLKLDCAPDLVLTHYREDRHQDHRQLSDLTYNTWRDHNILEYEVLKYDGDLGRPNLYLPLSEEEAREKARRISEAYGSQQKRQWFDEETFLAMMRVRGVECNAPYAEAFYSRKMVL